MMQIAFEVETERTPSLVLTGVIPLTSISSQETGTDLTVPSTSYLSSCRLLFDA